MPITENMDQITKYQNNKICLEFNDHMSPAKVEWGSNIHSDYSKIQVLIVDTSNGGGEKAVVVDANVDPIKMKRLKAKVDKIEPADTKSTSGTQSAEESALSYGVYKGITPSGALLKDGDKAIEELDKMVTMLQKNVAKYPANTKVIAQIEAAVAAYKAGTLKSDTKTDSKKIIPLLVEKKIRPGSYNTNPENPKEQRVTELTIEYNPNMNSPFTVKIVNGWGRPETTKTGGTNIASGSFRSIAESRAVIGDERFREMMLEVSDYIKYREKQMLDYIRPQVEKVKSERRKKAAAEKEAEGKQS